MNETLGDEFLVIRRLDDAADSYRAALGLADVAQRVPRARLMRKLARVHERQSRYQESTASLASALVTLGDVDAADPAHWWKEWIENQLAVSFVQYWLSDMTGLSATDARLQPVIEIWGSPVQRSQFHAARARRGLRQTRYCADAATLADAERSAATLDDSTDPFLRAETTFLLGFTQLWAGHLDEGGETLTRAAELSRRVGDAMYRVRSLVYLAVVRRRQGNVPEVGRLNDEARDLIRQLGSDDYQAIVLAEDAWLAWRRGAFFEATDAAAAAMKFCAEHTPNFPFQWPWLWVKLALDEQAGRIRDAAETAETMLRPSLAGQPANLEAQLRRIVAARSDDEEPALERELGHAVELAGAANYL